MINGVNFQPGTLEQEQQRRQQAGGSAQGVQEAIKVLSLRLPKVVGAQAVAPSALLRSQGSGGSPHVDSIVQSVMAKMFPGQDSPTPTAPMPPQMAQSEGPQVSGAQQQPDNQTPAPAQNFWTNPPRIIVGDLPPGAPGPEAPLTGWQPRWPTQAGVDGGGGFPGSMIAPLPDLRKYLEGLIQPQPPQRDEAPQF